MKTTCFSSDWYFTNCLRSQPKESSNFIFILEALADEDSDTHLLLSSLDELKYADVWEKLYALPIVLQSYRHPSMHDEAFKNRFYPIVNRFFDFFNEESELILKKIWRLYLDNKTKQLLDYCNTLIDNSQSTKIDNNSINDHNVPYLTYSAEAVDLIVILSIFLDLIRQGGEEKRLCSHFFESNLKMEQLLEAGVKNEYGRQVLILCASIVKELDGLSINTEFTKESIWETSYIPIAEPDLMNLYISLEFEENDSPQKKVDLLFKEYQTLEIFRALLKKVDLGSKDFEKVNTRYKRLGLKNKNGFIAGSIVQWQIGILHEAITTDSIASFKFLSKLWNEIPPENIKGKENTEEINNGNKWISFRSPRSRLLQLKYPLKAIRFKKRNHVELPADHNALIYSPWQPYSNSYMNKDVKSAIKNKYINVAKNSTGFPSSYPIVWFRYLAGLKSSIKLLKNAIINSKKESQFLFNLIIHISDAMRVCDKEIKDHIYNSGLKNSGIENETIKILLLSYKSIEYLNNGYYSSINPKSFVARLLQINVDESLSNEKFAFYNSTYPTTLSRWFYNSYRNSNSKNSILDLEDSYMMMALLDKIENCSFPIEVFDVLNLYLLANYIFKSYHDFDRFDWKKGKVQYFQQSPSGESLTPVFNKIGKWEAHSTQFHLTEINDIENLISEEQLEKMALAITENQEESHDADNNPPQKSKSKKTTLNPEMSFLMDALRYRYILHQEMKGEPVSEEDSWLSTFKDRMELLGDESDISRSNQLFLLDLLEIATLNIDLASKHFEIMERIAIALLEFGANYELGRMYDLLFKTTTEAENTESKFVLDLQKTVIKSMLNFQFLKSNSRINSNINSPYDGLDVHQKTEKIRFFLERLAYLNWEKGNNQGGELSHLFERNKYGGQLNEITSSNFVEKKVDILQKRNSKGKVYKSVLKSPDLKAHLIEELKFNPQNLTAKIRSKNIDTDGLIDFFEMSGRESKDYRYNKKGRKEIKSVLVRYFGKKYNRHLEFATHRFRCGWSSLLDLYSSYKTLGRNDVGNFITGEYYIVSLIWVKPKGVNRERWCIDASRNNWIRLPKVELGKIVKFYSVNEIIKRDQDQKIKESVYRHWIPDVSALFNKNREQQLDRPWPIQIERNNQVTAPLYGYLYDIFLNDNKFENLIALTYISSRIGGTSGREGTLFSLEPGLNIRLYPEDFDLETYEELQAQIEDYELQEAAFGIIFVFKPYLSSTKITLKLISNIDSSNPINQQFPDLQPIDIRNFNWRNIFNPISSFMDDDILSDDIDLIAEKKEDQNGKPRWVYDVPIELPGFPDAINIKINNYTKNSKSKIEFDIDKWSFRNQINQEAIGIAKDSKILRLPVDQDAKGKIINRFLNLQKGYVFEEKHLTSVIGNFIKGRRKNLFRAYDVNNFSYLIDISTFSFCPLEINYKPKKANQRKYIVDNVDLYMVKRKGGNAGIKVEIDASMIPEEVAQRGNGRAVFSKVSEGKLVDLIWQFQNENIKVQKDIVINNMNVFIEERQRIFVSDILEVTKLRDGSWVAYVHKKVIRLKPLWKKVQIEEGESYVYITHKNLKFYLEKNPGELVILDTNRDKIESSAPIAQLSHLSTVKIHKISSDNTIQLTVNDIEDQTWILSNGIGVDDRFVSAENNSNQLLYGETTRHDSSAKSLDLHEVKIPISEIDEQHVLFVNRKLKFKKGKSEKSSYPSYQKKEKTRTNTDHLAKKEEMIKLYRKNLEERVSDGYIFEDGDYNIETNTINHNKVKNVKFPSYNNGVENWGKSITLGEGQNAYINDESIAPYGTEVDFTVYENNRLDGNNEYLASFKKHSYSLLDYFHEVTDVWNKEVAFSSPLYFVGIEKNNPIDNVEYEEPHLRFEWGYGKSMAVPKSQILFEGEPFDVLKISFFFGDKILKATFEKKQTEETSDESIDKIVPIMNINSINIQFSGATKLYHQRKRFNFVHVLHLEVRDDSTLIIKNISGFNNEGEQNPERSWQIKRSRLDEAFHDNILNRGLKKHTIYGRLNSDRFYESSGEDVYFDHVALSFLKLEKGGLPLSDKNPELLFLRAGKIGEVNNDYLLNLHTFNGIHPNDVGKDFKRINLNRRQFSVREDILRKGFLQQEKLKKNIFKYLLPARIGKGSKGRPYFISVTENIPPRKLSIIRSYLKRYNHVYCTYFSSQEAHDSTSYTLEIQPSVFVEIPEQECWPDTLNVSFAKGDRLTITQEDKLGITKFIIQQAAPGDNSFISNKKNRPVVALPTNNLLKNSILTKIDEGAYANNFTIGGLPNIKVGIKGSFNNRKSSPDLLKEIMQMKHPKLAWLFMHKSGRWYISPMSNSNMAGKLIYDEEKDSIYLESLNSGTKIKLKWEDLSFAPISKSELKAKINSSYWSYHDTNSGYWIKEKNSFKIKPQSIYLHNALNGPIFLDRNNRLKYNEGDLKNFGFPVDEIIHAVSKLDSPEKTISVHFAGKKNDENGNTRYWFEISPGRIAELPPNLITWGLRPSDAQSFAHFNWQNLMMGDRIDLQLTPKEQFEIEDLKLVNYVSSNKRSFGPNRCFSPIQSYDEERGELRIGGGEFTRIFPTKVEERNLTSMAMVSRRDRILFFKDLQINYGEVINVSAEDYSEQDILTYSGYIIIPFSNSREWKNYLKSQNIEESEFSFKNYRSDQLMILLKNKKVKRMKLVAVRCDHSKGLVFVKPAKDKERRRFRALPIDGDTIFLELDDHGKIRVSGIPQLTNINPSLRGADLKIWEKDPLKRILFNNSDLRRLNMGVLKAIISTLGGYLPVTISRINLLRGELNFTRKFQFNESFLLEGQVTFASIIGELENSYSDVLLKAGDELIIMDVKELISGLNEDIIESNFKDVVHSLKDKSICIKREDGKIITQISEDTEEEFAVQVMSIAIDTKEDSKLLGLVCRSFKSSKLYWMDALEISWMQLNHKQCSDFYQSSHTKSTNLKARIISGQRNAYKGRRRQYGPSLSFNKVRSVQKEFEQLQIGNTITAEPLYKISKEGEVQNASTPQIKRYVAVTRMGMLITCNSKEERNLTKRKSGQSNEIPFEVVDKIEGMSNEIIVNYGARNYKMDIPRELFTSNLDNSSTVNDVKLSFYNNELTQGDIELLEVELSKYSHYIEVKKESQNLHAYFVYAFYLFLSKKFKSDIFAERIKFGTSLATMWINDHKNNYSVSLSTYIYSILLLRNLVLKSKSDDLLAEDWKREIINGIWNLVERATRSSHCEIFMKTILDDQLPENPLSKRLDIIRQSILTKKELTRSDVHQIKNFCYSVFIRMDKTYIDVAIALATAIGLENDLVNKMLSANRYKQLKIVPKLIEMRQYLPAYGTNQRDISGFWFEQSKVFDCLKDIIENDLGKYDLLLLDRIQVYGDS